MKRAIAAALAANTAFLQTASGLAVPGGLVVPERPPLVRPSVSDGGWLDISLVKQAQAEIPRPYLPRDIGVIGGHEDVARNDWELDRYLAGDWWCGKPCPGDIVTLVGEFNATRSFAIDGASGNPIIFKSAGTSYSATNAAKVTGQWTLPDTSSWLFLWGLRFCKAAGQADAKPGNRGSLVFGGNDNAVRRTDFTQWDRSVCILVTKGLRGLLDYCELHDPMPWVVGAANHTRPTDTAVINANNKKGGEAGEGTNLYSASPTEIPLRMGIRSGERKINGAVDPASWHYGFTVRHTRFHHFPDKPIPGNYNSGQGDPTEGGGDQIQIHRETLKATFETITVGGKSLRIVKSIDSFLNSQWLLDTCRFDNLLTTGAAFADFKVGGVRLRKLTCAESGGSFSFRTTCLGEMTDILCLGNQGISVHGYGHQLTRIEMIKGDFTPSLRMEHGNRNTANANSTGNAADLLIGNGHMAVQDCVLKQIRGAIILGDGSWAKDFPSLRISCQNCTPTPAVSDNDVRVLCSFNGQAATQTVAEVTTSDAGLTAAFVG